MTAYERLIKADNTLLELCYFTFPRKTSLEVYEAVWVPKGPFIFTLIH